ncbi:hypothetical protein ACWEL8_28510 [Streptomyces sp. NPDC004690]
MSAELGQLFDTAVKHIRMARPLASDGAHIPAVITAALDILNELDRYVRDLGWNGDQDPRFGAPAALMERTTADLRNHLADATTHLYSAARLTSPGSAVAPSALQRALAALTASRDLVYTHRGPDRQLLTPYALLLARASSQHYLAQRITDVTWQLGGLVGELAAHSSSPDLSGELQAARHELDQTTVLGRAAAREADRDIGSLPAAPALQPVPVLPDESPAEALTQLDGAGEQLLRIALEEARAHALGRRPLSGSDLPQLARSLAMTRLVSARLLEHATRDRAADSPLPSALTEATRHWHTTAEAWHHVVDLDDPSAHPLLPPHDYRLRRSGQASPLPQPLSPHPACDIATAMTLRAGRLLYGPTWAPHAGSRDQPVRSPGRLREEIGGVGRLLHTLYRMSFASRFLASAVPAVVENASHRFVTDSIEHRPPQLLPTMRFYPAHHRQIERINERHRTAGAAEKALSTSLVHHARAAGEPITRAGLDTAITELYLPDALALSPRQEAVLQRIMDDHAHRMAGFVTAVRRRTSPPAPPPPGQGQETPVQRGPRP